MSQAQDPPIIISGGSVTIEFNGYDFMQTAPHQFSNPNKKIQRVEITGDGVEFAESFPTGKCTIKIYYGSW